MKSLKRAASCAIAALTLVAGAAGTLAHAEADPAFGYWLNAPRKVILEIGACADAPEQACGQIVWLRKPLRLNGQPRIDSGNHDPALRSRPLCGLPMLSNLSHAATGEWREGSFYDPKSGANYAAEIKVLPEGMLEIQIQAGDPPQTIQLMWARETGARSGC